MKIRTKLDLQGIDERITKLQKRGNVVVFTPAPSKIRYAKREGEELVLKNISLRAAGKINIAKQEIVFDIRFATAYKIAAILTVFLFGLALFSNKVTINGNSNPSAFERIGYVLFGVLALLIPVLILFKVKSDFENEIRKEFTDQAD